MATDSHSGITQTMYSFDGNDWISYTDPFIIDTEGSTTIFYNSTDEAGNVGTTKTMTIKIDKTPPMTNIKSKERLGFKPKVPLRDGIKSFLEWYRKYYKA